MCDKNLENKLKERVKKIKLDFPEFLDVLTLLMNAGLTLPAAIQKIVKDKGVDRPLYQELSILQAETATGKSEIQAFEEFAKRIKVPQVTMFVSTVLQNRARGGTDMVPILRLLSRESWEGRKRMAQQLGEEASSKLLLPMILIFIAIAMITVAPAVISMGM